MFTTFNLKSWLARIFGKGRTRRASAYRHTRLVLEVLEDRLAPATYLWTGQANDGLWSSPQDWKVGMQVPMVAPGANDDVIFDHSNINVQNSSCTLDLAAVGTVANMTLAANYLGTITLEQSLTVTNSFIQREGEIAGQFPIYLNGGGSWTGGALAGAGVGNEIGGPLVLAATKTLVIANYVTLDGRWIENSGILDCTAATINLAHDAIVNNLPGATFRAHGNVDNTVIVSGQGTFNNYGFVEDQESANLQFHVFVSNLQGSFSSANRIDFDASTAFYAGAPSPGQNANLVGAGAIFASGGFSVTGNTSSTATSLNFNCAPAIGATFTVAGGQTRFYAPTSITGNLSVTGGELQLRAPLTVTGAAAGINVAAAGTFTLRSGLTLSGSTLSNAGILKWQSGDIELDDLATLTNTGNTYIQVADNDPTDPPPATGPGSMTGEGAFTNRGIVFVWTAATIAAEFDNQLSLSLRAGTLLINHDYEQGANARTTFVGGNLQINGNFTNGGRVRVRENGQLAAHTFINNRFVEFANPVAGGARTLTIVPNGAAGGNFTQGAAGSLMMRVTGNFNADLLSVQGTADLAGALQVTIPDGVNLNPNQSWNLINAGTVSNRFAAPADLPPGFSQPTYKPQRVAIQNPLLGACGPQATNQNVALVFAPINNNSISIPDPDAGSAKLEMTLSVTSGTLTLSGAAGLTFLSGDGSGDASMTFVGTIDAINAALNGLTFTPSSGFTGNVKLAIAIRDTAESRGAYSDQDSVDITVNAVAGAPTLINLTPNSGPTSGGTRVFITGTNFTADSRVYFGVWTSSDVTFVSAMQLIAVSPAQFAGTVYVFVQTDMGASSSSSASYFTYVDPTLFLMNSVQSVQGATTASQALSLPGLPAVAAQPSASASVSYVNGLNSTEESPSSLAPAADGMKAAMIKFWSSKYLSEQTAGLGDIRIALDPLARTRISGI